MKTFIKIEFWSLFLILEIHCYFCALKVWNKNFNFDQLKNWDLQHVPNSQETVSFPSNLNAAVYIEKANIGSSMILPNNGLLVFSDSSALTLNISDNSLTNNFVNSQWNKWFNPDNWNSSDFKMNEKDFLNPIPHSERIPCHHDDLIFPEKNSFHVSVSQSVIARSISYNGEKLMDSSFNEFLRSTLGKMQFKVSQEIRIAGENCPDSTGCSCGYDSMSDEICPLVNCIKPYCSNAIKPVGHCCDTCGSYLVMTYKKNFNLNAIRRVTESLLKKRKYSSCLGYLSKISNNRVQFVVTDNGDGKSLDLAKDFKDHIESDMNNVGTYKVKTIELHSSGKRSSDIKPSDESSSSLIGKIFGILLAVIITIALIILGLYMYKNHRSAGFGFVRFSSNSKIELELEGSSSRRSTSAGSSSNKYNFANPIYDLSDMKGKPFNKNTAVSQFENPLYSED